MKNLVINVALAPYRIDFYNALSQDGESAFYFTQDYVEGSQFDMDALKRRCLFEPRVLETRTVLGRKVAISVWALLNQCRPERVFVSEFSLTALLVLLYQKIRARGMKVISICDDSMDMLEGNDFSKLHAAARKLLTPLFDDMILLDSRAAAWYQKNYDKGIWFPLIRDERIFRKELDAAADLGKQQEHHYNLSHRRTVLYVGRLIALKNLRRVIQAMEDIPARLIIVGDGEERAELQKLCEELKIDALFCGWCNGPKLLAWYHLADVLVLPSLREAFGAVVNEALIAGCLVCVSQRAGSACLVTENNGLLIDPENTKQIHDSLQLLLEQTDPQRRDKRPSLMPCTFQDAFQSLTCKL